MTIYNEFKEFLDNDSDNYQKLIELVDRLYTFSIRRNVSKEELLYIKEILLHKKIVGIGKKELNIQIGQLNQKFLVSTHSLL